MIKDIVFYFYGYVVFFYSMGLIVSYVILMWLAELGIFRKKRGNLSLYTKEIIEAKSGHQRNEGKMPITATRNPMPSVMLAAWDFFICLFVLVETLGVKSSNERLISRAG